MNDMTSIITTETEAFTHETLDCEGVAIDIIQLDGNIWFSAPAILLAMGFPNDGKNTSQRLKRVCPPDIIKVTDTPFRFPDGRRNGGSLISPRAVMQFAGTTQASRSRSPVVVSSSSICATRGKVRWPSGRLSNWG